MWPREQGCLGVGSQAREADPQLSQLGAGTSVTGLSTPENGADQHLLEMPPWKPSGNTCELSTAVRLGRGSVHARV